MISGKIVQALLKTHTLCISGYLKHNEYFIGKISKWALISGLKHGTNWGYT